MRFVRSYLAVVITALALLAGCDEVRTAHVSGDVTAAERDAARDLLGLIEAITEQPTEVDEILRATDSTSLLGLLAPPGTPLPASSSGVLYRDLRNDCLLLTDSAATLTECDLGEHVIDGTWSVQNQRLHAELVDVFVVSPGQHGSLWIDANLSSGELGTGPLDDSLDGFLETSLMWTVGNRDYALDASLRVEGLMLDRFQCATSGSITIVGSLASASDSTMTLWFGPGCNDLQISR